MRGTKAHQGFCQVVHNRFHQAEDDASWHVAYPRAPKQSNISALYTKTSPTTALYCKESYQPDVAYLLCYRVLRNDNPTDGQGLDDDKGQHQFLLAGQVVPTWRSERASRDMARSIESSVLASHDATPRNCSYAYSTGDL